MTALLATASDLELRFGQYEAYPSALWRVCRSFNELGYLLAIVEFLGLDACRLDVGFSLPLQQRARAQGTEAKAIAFMQSARVQQALDLFLRSATSSTLEVERRHAQAKRSEQRRLLHLASASRTGILRRFLATNAASSAQIQAAQKELRRARHSNAYSLAWRELRGAVPRASGAIPDQEPFHGDSQLLQDHAAANSDRLEAALQQDRLRASGRLAAASGAAWLPASEADWVALLGEREVHFRALVREATQRRRGLSRRREADPAMPAPLPRLRPTGEVQASEASKLLRGCTGWYLFRVSPPKLAFVVHHGNAVHAMDMLPFTLQGNAVELGADFRVGGHLRPLEELLLHTGPLQVLEVVAMDADATPRGVRLKPTHFRIVQPRKRAPRVAAALGAMDESGEDSMEEWAWAAKDADVASVAPSVETDVEGSDDSVSDGNTVDEAAIASGAADASATAAASGATDAMRADAEPSFVHRAPPGTHVVWLNPWFYMAKNLGEGYVRIWINRAWLGVDELGVTAMSRALTPQAYGQTMADSTRCELALRAWACSRAMRGGWAARRPHRLAQIAADEERLEADVRLLAELDGLLGEHRLNEMLRQWVPHVVARLALPTAPLLPG